MMVEARALANDIETEPEARSLTLALVASSLGDRTDLGVHFWGDPGCRGAADPLRRDHHRGQGPRPGVTVCGAFMGSSELLEFVPCNPGVALCETRYTHDGAFPAEQPRLVAINAAVEVDLTAQINAEVAGDRYIDAVGGALDFVRRAPLARRSASSAARFALCRRTNRPLWSCARPLRAGVDRPGSMMSCSRSPTRTPKHRASDDGPPSNAGLPLQVPGMQLDRRCGGGLQAIISAAMMVQTGAADVVLAGGVESVSNVEHYTQDVRWGRRSGGVELHDRLGRGRPRPQPDGRFGPISGVIETAENLAQEHQVSREAAESLDLHPIAAQVRWAASGSDPARLGIGPAPAVARLFVRTGLAFDDLDLIELNEAFAVQVLAMLRCWNWDDRSRLNVNGSGISLGHPIGATGARIMTTMLYELACRAGRLALETMCIGGGQGLAAILERV